MSLSLPVSQRTVRALNAGHKLRVPAAATAAAAAASRSLAVCAALEERGPVWQCTAAETPQPSTTGASPAPPMRHADWTQVCV
ncbi:hypothetical protein QQF64_027578 [Cirrhinus molitorella]|uniref:Uncharacterized protein n=1 Tax=Cirrhinus molitorella TaxID=172907 RepID=A0ABR3ND29_9TELE